MRSLLILLLVLIMAAPSVFADRRKYVWTYQYATIAADATELEFYQTTKVKKEEQNKANAWEYRIEIEHGITPNWDLSVYQIFAQDEGGDLKWDAFQIRTRYKLAQPGEFFLDPIIYLEYQRKTDLSKQNKFEGKLILGRDFNKVNLALNPLYEFFWAPGEPVHEIGLDGGLSYELNYKLSIGVESTSRLVFVDGADNKKSSYFGPTVSFATSSVFYTVGYAWGVTDASDYSRVRFLMGIGL